MQQLLIDKYVNLHQEVSTLEVLLILTVLIVMTLGVRRFFRRNKSRHRASSKSFHNPL